jgi:hypothetical protein
VVEGNKYSINKYSIDPDSRFQIPPRIKKKKKLYCISIFNAKKTKLVKEVLQYFYILVILMTLMSIVLEEAQAFLLSSY